MIWFIYLRPAFPIIMQLILATLLLLSFSTLNAMESPNAGEPGPFPVTTGEYHLPAQIYDDVLDDRETELWANVHYPEDLTNNSKKLPLILLLHGNHSTCSFGHRPRIDSSCYYTKTGNCPPGFEIVNNHKGYDYLAQHLASWGFIVVSVNANRGITCGDGVRGDYGLNLARGRLLLKHLQQLYIWSQQGYKTNELSLIDDKNDFAHQIDFTNVGLFGHSRGGEGVRAAYNLYLDPDSPWPNKIPNLTIKAIFEIGAVDGQSDRILDAKGIAWNQLIPLCDGDVSDFQGRFPFSRMLLNPHEPIFAQKSIFEVWGANHNFFNTEWQTTDNRYCPEDIRIYDPKDKSSEKQQLIAKKAVLVFFNSQLGDHPDNTFEQVFNPLCPLPKDIADITQIDRDFTPTPAHSDYISVDEFDKPTGVNHSGLDNDAHQIQIEHQYIDSDWGDMNHDKQPQRAAWIRWGEFNEQPYFKAIFSDQKDGVDANAYATLDFRLARERSRLNTSPTTNFNIQLEDGSGHVSNPVSISDYVTLNGPSGYIPILMTTRIPLAKFSGVNKHKLRAVKFSFNKSNSGAIYLANIRLHKQVGVNRQLPLTQRDVSALKHNILQYKQKIIPERLNHIKLVSPPNHNLKGSSRGQTVELRLTSQVPFDAIDSLPVLRIGNQTFKLSRYPNKHNLREIAFVLTAQEYQQLNKRIAPVLNYGKRWQFRALQHF